MENSGHMATVTAYRRTDTPDIDILREDFNNQARLTGYSAAAATFLLIGALVIITCGSLCTMLPGINVISDIILKAVVPGLLAIIVSIPLILMTVNHARGKRFFRKEMINEMITFLDTHDVPRMPEKERLKFFLVNILKWEYKNGRFIRNKDDEEDQKKIIGDIKKKIGEEKDKEKPRYLVVKNMSETLDEALKKVVK